MKLFVAFVVGLILGDIGGSICESEATAALDACRRDEAAVRWALYECESRCGGGAR